MIACVSAAGQVIPPMVLLQGKKLNLSQAWYRGMTTKTISASFRAAGVYPFNWEAIHIPEA